MDVAERSVFLAIGVRRGGSGGGVEGGGAPFMRCSTRFSDQSCQSRWDEHTCQWFIGSTTTTHTLARFATVVLDAMRRSFEPSFLRHPVRRNGALDLCRSFDSPEPVALLSFSFLGMEGKVFGVLNRVERMGTVKRGGGATHTPLSTAVFSAIFYFPVYPFFFLLI